MQERRKIQRKNLMAYTQVFDLAGGTLIGYLGDLHSQGAMVIGEKLIKVNIELTLAIELPILPNVSIPRISIPARVAWSQQDISPEFFNIGFEFKEVTPKQATIIESIMQNYEFRRVTPAYVTKPPIDK